MAGKVLLFISFFLLNLMQILYLVGVGLLLTFDLLACVDSQGMLYYILMPKCNTTYRMLLKIRPFKGTPSPPLTEIKWMQLTSNVEIGYLHLMSTFTKLFSKE